MKQKVINILQEIRPEFDFNQEMDFIEEGTLDSFDIVTLVTSLDEKFGISIDGMDIVPENFITIETIMKLLVKNGVQE